MKIKPAIFLTIILIFSAAIEATAGPTPPAPTSKGLAGRPPPPPRTPINQGIPLLITAALLFGYHRINTYRRHKKTPV
jgi:hypothetical protein